MASGDNTITNTGPLDVVKYRGLYLAISAVFLLPGIVAMIMNMMNPDIGAPVRMGIDFTGGTLLEYGFERQLEQADVPAIRAVFGEHGYDNPIVQIQNPVVGINEDPAVVGGPAGEETPPEASPAGEAVESEATTSPAGETAEPDSLAAETGEAGVATIVSIRTKHLSEGDAQAIVADLQSQFGQLTLLQKYSIGPSLASELLQNGLLALLLAYLLIVGYLTYRFEFDYAVCAIIALAHDVLFVLGVFAIMGQVFHTEIDSLFITAILTVIGFSVHDTIVVFDRIRENVRIYFTKKLPFTLITNLSVNQTLARSINTSVSTLLALAALYFFGGETTKDFVLAAILGIAVGTYSSIFLASALLAWWREKQGNRPQAAPGGHAATT